MSPLSTLFRPLFQANTCCYALVCNTPISSLKVPDLVRGQHCGLHLFAVHSRPRRLSSFVSLSSFLLLLDGMPEPGSCTWLVSVSLDAAGRRTGFSVFL